MKAIHTEYHNLDFKIPKEYTAVELFTGAGGLALGLEMAGFKNCLNVEIDEWACKTLRKNRPNWNIYEGSVADFAEKNICEIIPNKEIDLIAGGFPCQAFSYAGQKRGLQDTRGTLFYDFANIVRQQQPKLLLAENVKGLVTHDNGNTFKTILLAFSECGYKMFFQVLNSVYYNVPQKRERVVIIGIRDDVYTKTKRDFIFPIPSSNIINLREALKDVPKSPHYEYSNEKKKVFKMVKPGGCWRDLPEDIAKDYMKKSYYLGGGKTGIARKMSWDEPSLTVLCSPAQKQTDRCHPEEIRPFTIRESARIQTFPDNWEFSGSILQQYKQIGNAVPVEFAKSIGLSIKSYLDIYENEI
jgi:DNA (cytosine-5)-methyltransferase 1